MATRTVSSDRDRKMTILLTPYMSCSAKISIYAFFYRSVLSNAPARIMILLYLLGILIGIAAALIMNQTVFRRSPCLSLWSCPPSASEPQERCAAALGKGRDFAAGVYCDFSCYHCDLVPPEFDTRLNVVADSADSLLALIGRWIAPVFAPLGCGLALRNLPISGFYRKGIWVVSTLQILLGGAALSTMFTGRSVISFSGVHAAVYSLHRGGSHDSTRIRLSAEDSWGRDDAVLRGMDRGSCCLYLGGDPVMHLLDWVLLVSSQLQLSQLSCTGEKDQIR